MQRLLAVLSLLVLAPGCSGGGSDATSDAGSTTAGSTGASTLDLSSSGSGSSGATTGGSTAGPGGSGSESGETQGVGPCVQLACEGEVLACGDCEDNDGDGLVDLADPECVSPCDDLEDTFATGLPGDNMDACNQDCFFDGNSGSGDDKCTWNLKCDPANPGGEECPYDPNFNNCPEMQSEECLMNCAVPNGCDCFGCCTVQFGDETIDIFIGDEDCSLDAIEQCEQCTKTEDCDDDCEPQNCELCFGQNPEDLPPECDEVDCPEGVQPCMIDAQGGSECPETDYCFQGCCVPVPG